MKVNIEKMIYGGDGLGRIAPAMGEATVSSPAVDEKPERANPRHTDGRGKAVFVPFVLQGEEIEIKFTEERQGFARGELLSLHRPSRERVQPGCPYFGRCGGCQYQHANYEHQLAIKEQVLRDTLRRTAKVELAVELNVHPSPPWHYRNRTRMKVQSTSEFGIGYYAHASHRFLPVEQCPISARLINRALSALRHSQEFRRCAPNLLEVQFFTNHDESTMLLEFYTKRATAAAEFQPVVEELQTELPELCGAALFQATRGEDEEDNFASPIPSRTAKPQVLGESSLQYVTAAGEFSVSAGSFFQTNLFLIDELTNIVVGGHSGVRALDLFAGVGLFSVPLSRAFEQVTAVEVSPSSVADLRINTAGKVECIAATTEQFLRTLHAGRMQREAIDLIVVDPPRGGLGEKTSRALARLNTSRLTYVSCDPATLSRDLRVLLESGFRVKEAHLVDLFPQTYHMETVLHLVR